MTQMWETVPRLLAANKYMVLATADADGVPWATPVYFAPRDESRLYWVSSPDSRHSRNIAVRATVTASPRTAGPVSASAGPTRSTFASVASCRGSRIPAGSSIPTARKRAWATAVTVTR